MSVGVAAAAVAAGAWPSTGAQSCASRCGAACCGVAAGALLAGVAGAFQLVGALGSTSRISCADTGPTAANKAAAGIYTGVLYRTTGPAFNTLPFDPSHVTATPVGSATLTFASGNAGTFAYTVNGVSQSKSITRQVFRTPGTVCR